MIRNLSLRKNDVLILLAGMLGCGLIALLSGKDLSWDVANYHYYIPYAYLHQRWLQDFWPASYPHMNFSPSADFLTYFLITYFSVHKAVFLSGAIQGINFWVLYKIAELFWREEYPGDSSRMAALAFAFLGLCQPLVILIMGGFENDLIVSIFVLSSFYFGCRWIRKYSVDKKLSYRLIAASGFLLGVAAGLKLTVVNFGVGSVLAVMCLPIPFRVRLKVAAVLGISAVAGLLLSNGYWMLNLWQRFHNPFYPFFSLHSHAQNHLMESWRATDWYELLLFPFLLARDGSITFLDFQFAFVYLLFIFAVAQWIYKNKILKQTTPTNLLILWFYAFFIISYCLWVKYFGVARYVRSLAMLSPLLIYVLLDRLTTAPLRKYCVIAVIMLWGALFASLASSLGGPRWTNYQNSYFNVVMPAQVKKSRKALVLMSYPDYALYWNPRPQTYLIPFFPQNWRFVGIPFNDRKKTFLAPEELLKIRNMIAGASENIYLLTSEETLPQFYQVSTALGLRASGNCASIFSDRQLVSHTNTMLCPLSKLR